jgi:hypothetical protein
LDPEAIGGFPGNTAAADYIGGLGAPAAVLKIDVLIPLRVEIDPPLLAQHSLVMPFGIESLTTVIAGHLPLSS